MAIKLEHWDQQVEHFGFFKKQTTAYNDFFSSLEYFKNYILEKLWMVYSEEELQSCLKYQILKTLLTESDSYPQLPTHPKIFYPFQTYTVIWYVHPEFPRDEKPKFECEEKKFSLLPRR